MTHRENLFNNSLTTCQPVKTGVVDSGKAWCHKRQRKKMLHKALVYFYEMKKLKMIMRVVWRGLVAVMN